MAITYSDPDALASADLSKSRVKPGSPVGRLQRKAQAQARQESPAYQGKQFAEQAKGLLPDIYAPAYASISEQFQPQFRRARAYLASNPAMARSGAASRLDRLLQQQAFGQLGQSIGESTAGVAGRGIDLIGDMIRRRQEERYRQAAEERSKGGPGGALGGAAGYVGKRAVDKFLPI